MTSYERADGWGDKVFCESPAFRKEGAEKIGSTREMKLTGLPKESTSVVGRLSSNSSTLAAVLTLDQKVEVFDLKNFNAPRSM